MQNIHIKLIDIYLEEIRPLSIEEHYDHLECVEKMVCHLMRNIFLGKASITERMDLLCLMAHAHKMCIRNIQKQIYTRHKIACMNYVDAIRPT